MKIKRMVQWGNEMFRLSNEKGCEPSYRCITLSDAYRRPSIYKQQLYEYWLHWFKSMDEGNGWFGIYSYNTNFVQFCGKVTIGGTEYGFIIYPSRNVAWELDKEVCVH